MILKSELRAIPTRSRKWASQITKWPDWSEAKGMWTAFSDVGSFGGRREADFLEGHIVKIPAITRMFSRKLAKALTEKHLAKFHYTVLVLHNTAPGPFLS